MNESDGIKVNDILYYRHTLDKYRVLEIGKFLTFSNEVIVLFRLKPYYSHKSTWYTLDKIKQSFLTKKVR